MVSGGGLPRRAKEAGTVLARGGAAARRGYAAPRIRPIRPRRPCEERQVELKGLAGAHRVFRVEWT